MILCHHRSMAEMLRTLLFLGILFLSTGCSQSEPADHADEDHADESHVEEGKAEEGRVEVVELTQKQVEGSGIRVQAAAPGVVDRLLTLPVVITANADAVTHVNPKSPGIVRSIHAHLGQEIAAGDLLCTIDSVELSNAVANYLRAEAMVEAAQTTLDRESALFAGRLATEEKVLNGAIDVNRKIHVRELDLQKKAVSTIRPLLEAEKALQYSTLDKERQLTELRAERDARLLALEINRTERRIQRDAAANAILALGLNPAKMKKLEDDSPVIGGSYEIRATRAGIVTARHITTGEFVDTANKLFTIEDLSDVWVIASVYEQQLPSVRIGQVGRVRLNAFPDLSLESQVSLIGFQVDAESRALRIRLVLDNRALAAWPEDYPLRPGMFGSVELVVEQSQARVALPESAVVHEDVGTFVFVRTAPGIFEQRPVELGDPSGNLVEIMSGVEPGDEVVVTGTFTLKSALRKGELGEGHSH